MTSPPVVLENPSIPYTALDTNPEDVFTFSGLPAVTYALTFVGKGTGGYGGCFTISAVPSPEPQTYAMLFGGLGPIGLMSNRRKRG